jgi:hypothetical protein
MNNILILMKQSALDLPVVYVDDMTGQGLDNVIQVIHCYAVRTPNSLASNGPT